MGADRGAELVQRFAVGGFIGREIEAAGCLAQGSQQERLALPTTGDNAERRPGTRVGRESGERHPLDVPVEHVIRFA